MTSIFIADCDLIPFTVIKAEPCKVVAIKTEDKDGYSAVQLGYGSKKEKTINKPVLGYYKKKNLAPSEKLKEFAGFDTEEMKVGDDVKVEIFKEGERIKVRGRSIGKGFQGVMKRHGFSGVGGSTHGQSNRLRAPGSIGQSSYPSRVFKGHRMGGRTGFDNVTVSNLLVVKVVPEENLIMIKGAVPGSVNSIVELIKK